MNLFSQCFRNSHFSFQITSTSRDYCDDISVHISSYDYICNPAFVIISLGSSHFGSRESMPVSHQNGETSKDIDVDVLVFVGSSVLYCRLVKQLSLFVTVSILNLQFFVWAFSKSLIMACVVTLLWRHTDSLCFKKCQCDFFPPTSAITHKKLTLTTNCLLLGFYTGMQHQRLGKNNIVYQLLLKEAALFLLILFIVGRNCKTGKLLFRACIDIPLPLQWS